MSTDWRALGLGLAYLLVSLSFALPTTRRHQPVSVTFPTAPPLSVPYNVDLRLFKSHSVDHGWLSAIFIAFKSSQLPLSEFMEKEYGVDCRDNDDSERAVMERCLKRHVALFYEDYIMSDGEPKRPRPFPIPQCDYLNIPYLDTDHPLGDVGGSQSRVTVRHIRHFSHTIPYLVKTFNNKEERKPFEPRRGLNRLMMMSEDGLNRRRNDKGAYHRETVAFNLLPSESPFFIHPVCFWDAHQAILYPFMHGGDLVPTAKDDAIMDVMEGEVVFRRIAKQLIEAVHVMHVAGIAHMDLKPENILIGGRNSESRSAYMSNQQTHLTLKIIDFGLSIRTVDFKGLGCLKVGTKVTMSPEQLLCHRPITAASDWWGVGATLYRMRVMWDPLLDTDDEEEEDLREGYLNMRDHHWQHAVMRRVEEFGEEWNGMMMELLQLYPEHRQFDKDMEKLRQLPFLQSK